MKDSHRRHSPKNSKACLPFFLFAWPLSLNLHNISVLLRNNLSKSSLALKLVWLSIISGPKRLGPKSIQFISSLNSIKTYLDLVMSCSRCYMFPFSSMLDFIIAKRRCKFILSTLEMNLRLEKSCCHWESNRKLGRIGRKGSHQLLISPTRNMSWVHLIWAQLFRLCAPTLTWKCFRMKNVVSRKEICQFLKSFSFQHFLNLVI